MATTDKAGTTANCTLASGDACAHDAHSNGAQLRHDIRETSAGPALHIRLKVTDAISGGPLPNAWIKIAHSHAGHTLSGTQVTDAYGDVTFTTIYPLHDAQQVSRLHFRVYVASALAATAQLTFPANGQAVYASNPQCAGQRTGPQPLSPANILLNGYALQLAGITANDNGGYDATLVLPVNTNRLLAPHTTDAGTGGHFILEQNQPAVYDSETTIPFYLEELSDVELELYDMQGNKVASQRQWNISGYQSFTIDARNLGIPTATYIYQLVVNNAHGTWRQCKVMTAAKQL